MGRILLGLVAALAVSACVQNKFNQTTVYLDRHATPNPSVAECSVCHGFNCTEKKRASLSKDQWQRVAAVFKPRAKTPQEERRQVARAVALVESFVGPQVGIAARQWTHYKMYVLPNLGDTTQIDCVDAAVNTWTYMTLMEREGLLQFHRVAQLSNGGSVTDPNLRNTAVLQEKNGGYFAVDASLVDHGTPPPVMPLEAWMGDWPPAKSAIETAEMKPVPAALPVRINAARRSAPAADSTMSLQAE